MNKDYKKFEELENKISNLEKELSFYKSALDSLPNPIFIKNENAEFVFLNNSYSEFFKVDRSKLLGTTVEQSTYLDAKDKFRYHVEDTTLLQNATTINYEVPFLIDNESIASLYWSCGFNDTTHNQRGIIGEIVSVSDSKSIERKLLSSISTNNKGKDITNSEFHNQSKHFFKTILNYYQANKVLIFEFDFSSDCIKNIARINLNDSIFEDDNLYIDMKLSEMVPLISILKQNVAYFVNAKQFGLYNSKEDNYFSNSDSLIYAPIFSKSNEVMGLIVVENPQANTDKLEVIQSTIPFVEEDLSKSKVYENILNIRYLDELTNIYNRNKYTKDLLELKNTTVKNIGILVADINGLHTINEFYGENSGDIVLIKSAKILKKIFGNNVFRVGDDEFIVLYKDTNAYDFNALVDSFKNDISNNEFCNLSFGYIFVDSTNDIQSKISYANELMTVEKQSYYRNLSGKQSKVAKYSQVIIQTLISELRDGRFTIFLQPQVNLETEEVIGAEALIRKFDVDGSTIPPMKFLPFYENEKIIRHVDLFVVETVCETILKWRKLGKELKIAVNLSRVTLMERDIIKEISCICDSYNVPKHLIELEVTETNNIIDNMHLKEVLHEAKKAGFSLSLDDFGAEYSNLQILISMEFTQVKFDKALIDNICTDTKSATIVEYAIKMCEQLNIKDLIAEGIETKEQKEMLKSLRCINGQGYFYSKPLPIDVFEETYF